MTLTIDRSRSDMAKITFTVTAPTSDGPISVVGSFNDWTAGMDELVSDGNGLRSVTVGIPYVEQVVFRYLGPGDRWFDEPDADYMTPQGSVVEGVRPP